METRIVPIDTLSADPSNVRKHGDKNIAAIKASLKRFGQQKPIVVDGNLIVRAGNGTLQAAQELGWDEISVIQSGLAPSELVAFAIADNRTAELAEWDMDGLAKQLAALDEEGISYDELGFEFPDDHESGNGGGLTDPDEVPEVTEPVVKRGEIWKLGKHRLLCGDSTDKADVERLMGGEKADMVFTDPPYGLNWSGGTWAKNENYQRAKEWDILLSDTDVSFIIGLAESVIIWGGNYYSMPPSKSCIAWKKPHMPTMADFELAWTNFNKPAKMFESSRTPDGKKCHAAQKPVALVEWCFENYGNPKSVLDLFLGSGTTLIACEKTSRRCYGMEIDPHYCDVIIKRWEDFTGEKAVNIGGR